MLEEQIHERPALPFSEGRLEEKIRMAVAELLVDEAARALRELAKIELVDDRRREEVSDVRSGVGSISLGGQCKRSRAMR